VAWDDADVARLKSLVADRLSASQIGAILGRSRDSVISKCRSQGLTLWFQPHPRKAPKDEKIVWAPEQVALLRTLYFQGLAYSQIAQALTNQSGVLVTKSAICGKVRRLQLPERTREVPSPPKGAERAPNRTSTPMIARVPDVVPATARRRDQRQPLECSWIFGDGSADALMCCRPVTYGKPYCPDHVRRAYRVAP
jgi:hypothetical protein